MGGHRRVHVTYGFVAGADLRARLGSADTLVLSVPDDFSCGPLKPLRELDAWRAQRLAFWDELPGPRQGDERRDVLPDVEHLAEADEVTVWVAAGLADQLMLAFMPQLLRLFGVALDKLRVVQFHITPKGRELPTLGMLTASELASGPAPRELTPEDLACLDDAWSAVTSADPRHLLAFVEREGTPLPIMQSALRRLLLRYPAAGAGVNYFEEMLLRQVRDQGPKVARVIGSVLGAVFDENRDSIGDGWLFWRLHRLANPELSHPAATLTGTRTEMRGTEVHLTDDGLLMLEGKANFVERNAIDDWVAGVHLDSHVGRVWFYRNGTLKCPD